MTLLQWIITIMEGIGALAALAGVIVLVSRRDRLPRTAWVLLFALLVAFAIMGVGNVLEWTNISPYGDVPEDFVMPLVPVLWLFLFVTELDRVNRKRLRTSYEQLKAVHNLATELTVTMEPHTVMQDVVEMATRLMSAPLAVIFLPDDQQATLQARAAHGLSAEECRDLVIPIERNTGIGSAYVTQKPVRTADAAGTAVESSIPLFERFGITALVDMPLVHSGKTIGILGVARKAGPSFSDEEVALLETLGAYAAVAIHNASLYERVVESEAKYRVLVENAQVAISAADADGHVTFWNRGCEQLFGWPADDVIRRHIALVYPEDKWNEVKQDIGALLERDGYWFGEYPAVRQDGSQFTAFYSLSRVYDATGGILCTLGIYLDATEQAQLREQLFQAQKMETVGTLAGGIAHDFNNLLTGILGFASLLRPAFKTGDENLNAVLQIEEAAQRGTQLVRQLLTFSHKQPITFESVRLNTVVEEAATLIRRTFPNTINFVTRLDPDLYVIQADATQMHQILMNLAVNARDAMPKGGDLAITTENLDLDPDDAQAAGLQPGPHVRLTVADAGPGIPESDRPHIFEPFYTTKPKGTGLGLSTVYAIVTRHGGRITFRTEPGRGVTFHITLPAKESDGPASAPPRAEYAAPVPVTLA